MQIGTIHEIHRYPVKGMRGETLSQTWVWFAGLQGDRVWAFVRPDGRKNFPWHSAREQDDFLLYAAGFPTPPAEGSPALSQDDYRVNVTTPDGRTMDLTSDDFLKEVREKSGSQVTLRFSEKCMQDARPVSIFGLNTAARIGELAGLPVDPVRFRANFYVQWNSDQPFYEDTLVGKSVRIGDTVEMAVVKRDARCKVITLDPQTAAASPQILKQVAVHNQGCAGVYGAVLREGLVRQGDPVYLT